MKKFLRQLFCRHIWRTDKAEEISRATYKYKAQNVFDERGLPTLKHVDLCTYAVFKSCVKCGKEKIIQDEMDVVSEENYHVSI